MAALIIFDIPLDLDWLLLFSLPFKQIFSDVCHLFSEDAI